MYPFRRLFVAAAVVSAAVVMVAASAQADPLPVNVNPPICSLFQGHARPVKAGRPITIHAAEGQQTLGILASFLNAQTTTVSWSRNGGGFISPINLAALWVPPSLDPLSGSWVSTNDYQTGITLGVGETLSVTYSNNLSHILPEVYNPASPDGEGVAGQPAFRGPDTPAYTCTYTGVA